MTARFCPKCKSLDIGMVAGGVVGIWECKKCGFQGAIFPEIAENIKIKSKSKRK